MATLKDSVVSGSLRVTDTLYSTTTQFQILRAPTSSDGTTYGPGTNGNFLKSNGTSVYWVNLAAADIPNISTDKLTSGTLPVGRGGTGQTSIANIQAGKDGDGNTISSTYLKLSGSTAITGNLGINTKGRGLYLTDSSGHSYAAIYDNGSNLWIGAQETNQTSTNRVHTGGVCISTGWNGSAGNSTINLIVPTSVTGGGNTYSVLHSGNYNSYAVTLSTAQTISGTKTFSAAPYISNNNLFLKSTTADFTKTNNNVTGNDIWQQVQFQDTNGWASGYISHVYRKDSLVSEINIAAQRRTDANTIPDNVYMRLLSTGGIYTNTSITANDSIIAGTYTANTAQSKEFNVTCQGGAGKIYMYSHASTTGSRGLYSVNSAGTAKSILYVTSNNVVTLEGHATSDLPLTGGTITGTLTVSNSSSAGGSVSIFENSEGGNIALYSKNGIHYEMDAYNDNFRLISFNSSGSHSGTVTLTSDGQFSLSKALPIGSGGTAATTALSAAENLNFSPYVSLTDSSTSNIYTKLSALPQDKVCLFRTTAAISKALSQNKIDIALFGFMYRSDTNRYNFVGWFTGTAANPVTNQIYYWAVTVPNGTQSNWVIPANSSNNKYIYRITPTAITVT